MSLLEILLATGVSNKIWEILMHGGMRGVVWPKVTPFLPTKKLTFYGTSIFEGVVLNIMMCMYNSPMGNFITFLLVVIACQNSYFWGH